MQTDFLSMLVNHDNLFIFKIVLLIRVVFLCNRCQWILKFVWFSLTIIYIYSSFPANNAPWLSMSLFYNKRSNAQDQTCILQNKNHHIFMNHHTQRNRKNILILDMYIPCCNVRIKTMFGLSLPLDVVGEIMSYSRCLCLLAYIGVQHVFTKWVTWWVVRDSNYLPSASSWV